MSQKTVARPPVIGAKKRDYWWTVLFTDPLALPLVRFLYKRRWMTPDQVSILAAVLGLLVGPLFALGTRTGLIAGGLMFQAAFIVDCVDGKLARALETTSPKGEILDQIGDATRRASATLGLALYLWRSEDHAPDAVLVAVLYAVAAYYFIELSGGSEVRQEAWFKKPANSDSPPPEPKGLSGVLARWRLMPTPGMPDVQALVFVIGPISGFVVEALWVGTAVVGVGTLLSLWRHLR
ncbi:MAG TPA: CDP-alcohol phosphatidyltransferase family protein [Actinomycetota bacterium]|nr:CDP-alcohol phosphatidyltransferase family protein [Actinomycetota bacterium]